MGDSTLVILRWYHSGVLDLSSEEPIYEGGKITEFLNVDVDMISDFELRDYIKKLGYSTTCTFSIKPPNSGILIDVESDMNILDMCMTLKDEDIVEVYVHHIENVSHGNREKFGSSFNKGTDDIRADERIGEEPLSGPNTPFAFVAQIENTTAPSFTQSTQNTTAPSSTTASQNAPSSSKTSTANADDPDLGPVGYEFVEKGSDYSIADSEESLEGIVGEDEDYGSDEHEEVRELRAERRNFHRRKRRKNPDSEDVPAGETGIDLGFDEIETGKISLDGRLGIDEPYFPSSDDDNFEI
ncbi:hypothetical protein RND71_016443 [Anisodus tanguticus]|uniref:PB1-like domain-containing protein n=1 Tax=Anisodus tanguticus TaxID=243964 RepID=A0AAE1S7T0_9SOLA|nr:hypothetical protein RND71_016443 [Anisodus tanguticus]